MNKRVLVLLSASIVLSALSAQCAAPAKPTEAPTAEPKTAVAQSAINLSKQKSYRLKISTEKEGTTLETLYEVVMPDRIRIVSGSDEMIGVGQDAYAKEGDSWSKLPGQGPGNDLSRIAVKETDILEARLEGKEDVDGVPCNKYVYTAKKAEGTPTEVTIWIGTGDRLPYKIFTRPDQETTTVQKFYDFGADIKIEAPTTK